MSEARVISATEVIKADPATIFEHIADPAKQPSWDGNNNLQSAEARHRVTAAGQMFVMTLTNGKIRENHVTDFEEGRRIAWMPASPGKEPAGHKWAWSLTPVDGGTEVTHTYDWRELTDEQRVARARATTTDNLRASVLRLRDLIEAEEAQ